METFLPYKLNLAERNKDVSKTLSLGPFASAINEITGMAQNQRADKLDPSTPVYRGAKLPLDVFLGYQEKFINEECLFLNGS